MNKRPIIGITTTQVLKENTVELWKEYIDAISMAGGIPILLPSLGDFNYYEEYLDMIDGLFLTGGEDIMPQEYGEEPLSGFKIEWEMTPERDKFEIDLTKMAERKNIPILGVCRGMQIINIVFGGNLYQDIDCLAERDVKIQHSQECPYWHYQHDVAVNRESKLYKIMEKQELKINSMHHQAIKDIADGFRVCASAKDGIIEAIESENDIFIIGVQWHPERMLVREKEWLKLFKAFVDASRKRM